jgi:hypothetical protein
MLIDAVLAVASALAFLGRDRPPIASLALKAAPVSRWRA